MIIQAPVSILALPWRPAVGAPEVSREEDVPTPSQEPQADAWLPQAHEDRRRARGAAAPPAQGAQAAHGHRLQEVAARISAAIGPVLAVQDRSGFPQARRLRKRTEFLAVQNRGRRLPGRHFLFFVARRAGETPPGVAAGARFGITVTRKVGNAVTRNRIKRVLREGFRRAAGRFAPDLDLVAVARGSAAGVTARDALTEISELASRLAAELSR